LHDGRAARTGRHIRSGTAKPVVALTAAGSIRATDRDLDAPAVGSYSAAMTTMNASAGFRRRTMSAAEAFDRV